MRVTLPALVNLADRELHEECGGGDVDRPHLRGGRAEGPEDGGRQDAGLHRGRLHRQ